MRFEGYLYNIIDSRDSDSTDGAYAFRISLRPDSPIYAGHFPGFPITPGVALLTIVRELLERRLHRSLTLTSADDVKFLHPLTPAHNPVTITFKEFRGNTVKTEVSTSTALHARMTLSYEE